MPKRIYRSNIDAWNAGVPAQTDNYRYPIEHSKPARRSKGDSGARTSNHAEREKRKHEKQVAFASSSKGRKQHEFEADVPPAAATEMAWQTARRLSRQK